MRRVTFGMDAGPERRVTPARLAALARARAAQVGHEPRGSRNGAAKLTEAQVIKIRRLRAEGERPSVLALRFAVDRTLIWHIVKRRIWTHI